MVIDSSVILAILFKEAHAEWASEQLNNHRDSLLMSCINLTEVLILLEERQPKLAQGLTEKILNSGIRFIPPDIQQSRIAAKARLRFPLNLGDCFAYALAKQENCPILTLDKDFHHLDCEVISCSVFS